jgi:hypothetical protein
MNIRIEVMISAKVTMNLYFFLKATSPRQERALFPDGAFAFPILKKHLGDQDLKVYETVLEV